MNVNEDWSVSLSVAETDGQTRAEARLVMSDGAELAGHGQARRNPADREVARIGAQLAAARALSDLAGQLSARGRHRHRGCHPRAGPSEPVNGRARVREADRAGRVADRSV